MKKKNIAIAQISILPVHRQYVE